VIAASLVGSAILTWTAVALARGFQLDREIKDIEQEMPPRTPGPAR
jgi:hypothetical protein